MKYQFMDTHSSEFRLEKMSQILKVSRSGFYKWKNRKASMRKVSNEELLKKSKMYTMTMKAFMVARE